MKFEISNSKFEPSGPKVAFRAILAWYLILLCSCAHYKCDPDYDGPSKRPAEILQYYNYTQPPIEVKVDQIKENKKYVVERVEFPSTINVFGTEHIKVDYYVQKKQGKFPTVLILPIAGGIDFTIKSFANHFATSGFNCAVVHNRDVELKAITSAEEVENYFRQAVLDNRQVLDYLVQRKEVDKNRLGCLGLSLGGIKASLVSAVDERLKCSVIALAGGSIADIALSSEEKGIKDYIAELLEMGISSETIYAELSERVETDPLKLAQYLDARNVLMYIAIFDRVIPRKCGDRLWKASGKPEVVYLFSGHFSSIIYLPYAEVESLRFFKEKLK
ncbi:MAG: alpha/beta hydrolase family protein [Sedimentisphaerales bacterium]